MCVPKHTATTSDHPRLSKCVNPAPPASISLPPIPFRPPDNPLPSLRYLFLCSISKASFPLLRSPKHSTPIRSLEKIKFDTKRTYCILLIPCVKPLFTKTEPVPPLSSADGTVRLFPNHFRSNGEFPGFQKGALTKVENFRLISGSFPPIFRIGCGWFSASYGDIPRNFAKISTIFPICGTRLPNRSIFGSFNFGVTIPRTDPPRGQPTFVKARRPSCGARKKRLLLRLFPSRNIILTNEIKGLKEISNRDDRTCVARSSGAGRRGRATGQLDEPTRKSSHGRDVV